jgi:hypothetical protein
LLSCQLSRSTWHHQPACQWSTATMWAKGGIKRVINGDHGFRGPTDVCMPSR